MRHMHDSCCVFISLLRFIAGLMLLLVHWIGNRTYCTWELFGVLGRRGVVIEKTDDDNDGD